jgi:hypothetical protein
VMCRAARVSAIIMTVLKQFGDEGGYVNADAGVRGRAALILDRIGKGSCETHGKRLRI